MKKNYTIYQVDAFADEVFKGNPAAVVPLAQWLPDTLMQAIAAENNLSETAFFVKKNELFELRWFTPLMEVDLCGHATLASAHVLYAHLSYMQQAIHFSTRSGILTVEKADVGYVMNFPTDVPSLADQDKWIEKTLQDVAILELYKGKDDYLVVLDSETAVKTLVPDLRALALAPKRGLIITAAGNEVDFVSRCFYPKYGIDEDPATGSAHTLLTSYWAKRLGKTKLIAKQISQREGNLICHHLGDRVALEGRAVTYLIGTIFC